jgi:hypothetical protein
MKIEDALGVLSAGNGGCRGDQFAALLSKRRSAIALASSCVFPSPFL